NRQYVASKNRGYRGHGDVNRRLVGGAVGSVGETNANLRTRTVEGGLLARWGNVDDPGFERLSLRCLTNFHFRKPIQSLGKWSGEAARHVLHDQYRDRKICRQLGNNCLQGLGPSS